MTKRQLTIAGVIGAALLCFLMTRPYSRAGLAAYFDTDRTTGHRSVSPVIGGASIHACTSLYFLKTHKCASTTVQRIFMMYALKNNLTVALPLNISNLFFPYVYRPEISKPTCSHPHFDVVAAHTRFHLSARTYMARDTVFVSIVRDPAEQMESAYYYFLVKKHCQASRFERLTFGSYVRELIRIGPRNRLPPIRYPCGLEDMQFLQLYDFGLEIDPYPTRELVKRKIDEIDINFNLVLVLDRLDEGLILMRDMLGWSMDDLLYLKNNFRLNATSRMSAETRAAAYAWNWGDKMLYDHFRSKMDAIIQRREAYLRTEVRRFQELQTTFYKNCVTSETGEVGNRVGNGKARASVALNSYVLSERGKSDGRCQVAAMSEMKLFRHLNDLYPSCGQAAAFTAVTTTTHRHSGTTASVVMNISAALTPSQRIVTT